jgi:protoporphyrinogen oxidase
VSSTSNQNHVVIIGGGYTGLTAAYELCQKNIPVTIVESDNQLGGLAGVFEISPGVIIEKFYHHWFSNDTDILNLVEELGISDRLKRVETNTGLYFANSIFRLASPLDLLSFTPLPLIDRIRTGLMALYARRINSWLPLEDISAADWIRKVAGKKSFEVIWGPLLKGKFGREAENISAVWFWNKLKLRGSSRNEKAKEELLYIRGGFKGVTDTLSEYLKSKGVQFILNSKVDQIITENNQVTGVQVENKVIPCNKVLATVALPILTKLCKTLPLDYLNQCNSIRYLGNVCLVLRLKRSLSSTYWLNVSDPSFPFVGVIEHTNMDDKSHYAGEHIAYISKYLGTDEDLFKLSDQEYFNYCLPFIKKIFPEFSTDWLHGFACWRAEYSQPVISKNYSKLIPNLRAPISGLYLSSMAQVYPEDRGTNYAVREGRKAGKEIIKDIF